MNVVSASAVSWASRTATGAVQSAGAVTIDERVFVHCVQSPVVQPNSQSLQSDMMADQAQILTVDRGELATVARPNNSTAMSRFVITCRTMYGAARGLHGPRRTTVPARLPAHGQGLSTQVARRQTPIGCPSRDELNIQLRINTPSGRPRWRREGRAGGFRGSCRG